ncbi:MAG: nucleotidyltransferase domain-containing protein [Promethearchaeota archaeon]
MKLIDDYCYKILNILEFSRGQTFTDLIKTIKNRCTLSNRLKFLLKAGLIQKERGIYRLRDRGINVLNLLEQVENILYSEEIYTDFDSIPFIFRDYLYDFITTLRANFRENLLSVILFGSISRGKWLKDSDIDLFLIFSDDLFQSKQFLIHKLIKIKLELYKSYIIKGGVGARLNNPIQIFSVLEMDLKDYKTIFYDIAMDGIILLDRDGVGFNFLESVKLRIKNLKLKRIFDNNGNFYWQHKKVKFGEIIEL